MKHLKLFFALFAMLALGVGNAWGADYSIKFLTAASDGSTEITTSTKTSTVLETASCDYVTGFTSNCTKAYYKGKSGVKLSSSKAAGTIELTLSDICNQNISKVVFKTVKYSSDVSTLTFYAGSSKLGTIAAGSDFSHTFTTPQSVSTLKIASDKRAYISEIIISVSSSEPSTPPTIYDVTWMVNGEEWAISEDVEENTQITTLPTEPTDECAGKVFQGWTDKEITDGQKPAVLFKDKSPKITDGLTTFYAVFATETNSGSGNLTTTFTPNVDDLSTGKNGITIKMSNTVGANGYYQIFKSSSMTITSENAITSFTITCTASDKSKYGPGNITFTEGTYSYSGTTGTWTGNATSLTSGNAAEQLRIKSIVVTTSGGATISDYTTSCSGSEETVVSLIPKNGCLLAGKFT